MKLNTATLSEVWRARNEREKTLLTGLGALLGVALLYGILWAPAAAHRARLSTEIPVLQRKLSHMKQQAQQVRALTRAAASATLSGNALATALTASLTTYGLNEAKISTVSDGVRIQLSTAQFSSWVAWLESARKQYKVRVTETQIKALAQDGVVKVDAQLHAPQ